MTIKVRFCKEDIDLEFYMNDGLYAFVGRSKKEQYITFYVKKMLESFFGPLDGKILLVSTTKPKKGVFLTVPAPAYFCHGGLRKVFKTVPRLLYFQRP